MVARSVSEALRAHMISRNGTTNMTPYDLVYIEEEVSVVDVNLRIL